MLVELVLVEDRHVAVPVADDVEVVAEVDVERLAKAVRPDTRILYLANPNNPTGAHVPHAGIVSLIGALPRGAVLMVDQAYHDFLADAGRTIDLVRAGAPVLHVFGGKITTYRKLAEEGRNPWIVLWGTFAVVIMLLVGVNFDLRVGQVVDIPNYVVTAVLNMDVFTE